MSYVIYSFRILTWGKIESSSILWFGAIQYDWSCYLVWRLTVKGWNGANLSSDLLTLPCDPFTLNLNAMHCLILIHTKFDKNPSINYKRYGENLTLEQRDRQGYFNIKCTPNSSLLGCLNKNIYMPAPCTMEGKANSYIEHFIKEEFINDPFKNNNLLLWIFKWTFKKSRMQSLA